MDERNATAPWRLTSDAGQWSASTDRNGCSAYMGIEDADGNIVGIAVAHTDEDWASPDPAPHGRLMALAPELFQELQLLRQKHLCGAAVLPDADLVRIDGLISRAESKG
jgi:hypothetical protein